MSITTLLLEFAVLWCGAGMVRVSALLEDVL
jgi:hypothetical protein